MKTMPTSALPPPVLSILLDHLQEAVLFLSAEGEFIYANLPFEHLLGLPRQTLLGQTWQGLDAEAQSHLEARLGFGLGQMTVFLHQLRADTATPDEESYLLSGLYPRPLRRRLLLVEGGALFLWREESQSAEFSRLQEDFTHMMVHDLRSPLTAVAASLRLLQDMASPKDLFGNIVLQATTIAQRAIRRLLYLINSILDVARLESGVAQLDREPLELIPLIQRLAAEFEHLAQELEVQIITELEPDLPLAYADAERIERVLYNLLDNALKFSHSEGQVLICARRHAPHTLEIAIYDNGSGIPPEERARIFERYQQAGGATRQRGTGLGLTFCKLTIEAHGGRIWVEENPAGGAVFLFTLPMAGENI
jgi:signal transduction histidine kinase